MHVLPTPTQSSSPGTQREAANAHGSSSSDAELLLQSNGAAAAAAADPTHNADFLSFLNKQDDNGDTALNLAARHGDRAVIRMLLNAGASPTIANHADICPMHYNIEKFADLDTFDFDSAAAMPYNDNEHPVDSSPTPATCPPLPRAPPLNSFAPANGTPGILPMTPQRFAAMRGGITPGRTMRSSPAQANGRSVNGNGLPMMLDPGETWSPATAVLRMHQSVQDIHHIIAEVEADFSGEMRVKQVHLDKIKQQLRNTTAELAKARETIHHLQAKAKDLADAQSRIGYLEATLTRIIRELRGDIFELPLGSELRARLEAHLEHLLASSGEASNDGLRVRSDIEAELDASLPPVPSTILDDMPQDADLDKISDPDELKAHVRMMRNITRVYAERDAIMRERVAVMAKRAEVSERERQYRQIIASCCEIPEAD
ncbi:transcriptional regulator swi6, partial [Coemansia aciculifera]